ncbi:MAG TPA: CPBP family intramembrane glutamic endopeptidase, partial [Candidatus Acidoferrum sp.]|nr:CPBP family intramembrane glutamic endopeptidase [Candidatus Acidoferrum sp.]
MESITPDLSKPLGFARKRIFLGRLAEGVSQPPWSWRAAGGAVLVSFAGFLGLPAVCEAAANHGLPDVGPFWPILVWAIPMLGALAYLTRQAGTTVGKVFGLSGARVGAVLVSGLLLSMLGLLLMAGSDVLLQRLGFEKASGVEGEARGFASSFFSLTNVTVWAPLCEELWFRALLYTSLRTRLGVAASTVVTAALFAGVHYPKYHVWAAGLFLPAVLSSLWYERTRSLWPNVIAHSLFNLLPCVVVLISSPSQ